MSFTYSVSTDLGKLRLAIGDVTQSSGILPGGGNFSDDEANTAITLCGSWQLAAPFLLRAAAAQWGVKAASLSIGDYSEARQQVKNLNDLADAYASGRIPLPGAWSGMGLGTSTVDNIAVVD